MSIKSEHVIDLLGPYKPSEFGLKWIEESGRITIESIDLSYNVLHNEAGLSNEAIAPHADLLGHDQEKLRQNLEFMRKLGLSNRQLATHAYLLARNYSSLVASERFLIDEIGLTRKKIASQAQLLSRDPVILRTNTLFLENVIGMSKHEIATNATLLGRDPRALFENERFLVEEIGLTRKKIANHAHLLCMKPETIGRKAKFLREAVGMTNEKIAANAQLLSNSSKTIKRNYDNLRRYLSKEDILKRPILLAHNRETITASVQFLTSHGIDYRSASDLLLETTAKLKRQKMAVLLRGIFEDRNDLPFQNKVAILRNLLRDKPHLLVDSTTKLGSKMQKLRAAA